MNLSLSSAVCLSALFAFFTSCASQPVETCSLRDQIISLAKEVEGTGVKSVDLTTAVTKTKEGSVTVVVPASVATGTFGFKNIAVNATTVKMTIMVDDASKDEVEGSVYELDPQTLKAERVR